MNVLVKYQPTEHMLEYGEFVCQHPETAVETVEVTSFVGEDDYSYDKEVTYCTDCDELIEEY